MLNHLLRFQLITPVRKDQTTIAAVIVVTAMANPSKIMQSIIIIPQVDTLPFGMAP
jgi:hypothetical protein